MSEVRNVALVHGGFVDGSGWEGVYRLLKQEGFNVSIVQNPTLSLEDDADVTRRVLDKQDGPTILVGHSYGGQIMTALGTDTTGVAGLVYVAAFALDEGESLGALLAQGPTPPALVHQSVDDRGFVWLAEDDFTNHFAADVDPVTSKVMFAVQQPLASNTFGDAMGVPAWRSLPSWYLISTEDEAIPPPAQQMFAQRMGATTIEVPSSHLAMVSHPKEVVRLTEMAGDALGGNG